MGKSFRNALLRALGEHETSLETLADETGVSFGVLDALLRSKDASLSVEDAVKIAHYYGVTLDQFLGDPSVAGHIQIAQLYSALPPLLKAQLEAYAQELADGADHPRTPKPQ